MVWNFNFVRKTKSFMYKAMDAHMRQLVTFSYCGRFFTLESVSSPLGGKNLLMTSIFCFFSFICCILWLSKGGLCGGGLGRCGSAGGILFHFLSLFDWSFCKCFESSERLKIQSAVILCDHKGSVFSCFFSVSSTFACTNVLAFSHLFVINFALVDIKSELFATCFLN